MQWILICIECISFRTKLISRSRTLVGCTGGGQDRRGVEFDTRKRPAPHWHKWWTRNNPGDGDGPRWAFRRMWLRNWLVEVVDKLWLQDRKAKVLDSGVATCLHWLDTRYTWRSRRDADASLDTSIKFQKLLIIHDSHHPQYPLVANTKSILLANCYRLVTIFSDKFNFFYLWVKKYSNE